MRQWKLSPIDLPSRSKWYEYSKARDMMLKATDLPETPWHILQSDDKRRARLNCIAHLLRLIPHEEVAREKIEIPDRKEKHAYDDSVTLEGRSFIPSIY